MASQILKLGVLFHGLIAFLPSSVGAPTQMSAYLVNSPADCPHQEYLRFANLAGCASGCMEVNDGKDCECDLTGAVDIQFSLPTVLHDTAQGLYGAAFSHHDDLPADSTEARDFYYVPRISDIEGRDLRVKAFNVIDTKIGAVVRPFGWDGVVSCILESDQDGFNHAFAFINPLLRPVSTHTQAMSKLVMFQLSLIGDASNSYAVNVTRRSDKAPVLSLKFDCVSGSCPLLVIANPVVDSGVCADLTRGKHFALYDALVDGSQGAIPIELTFSKNGVKVDDACGLSDMSRGLAKREQTMATSRAICPMAILDP